MLRYMQIMLRYVMTSATQLSRDQFEQTIQEEFIDKQAQEGAMTIAQQLFLEGEIHGKQVGLLEGKQAGLLEGKQAGLIEIATRLFQRRFGHLPLDIALQLRQLSIDRLTEFGEALLDFASVDQARQWLSLSKSE
jgi:predicted transposase YdaD